MQHIRFPVMEVKEAYDVEHMRSTQSIQHELWPLDEIDPKKAKFPCCLVWTPLPIVSWLAPFIGHVGICREDGAILDFAGSNFVNADDFAFGAVARYLQLDRTQVLCHVVLTFAILCNNFVLPPPSSRLSKHKLVRVFISLI